MLFLVFAVLRMLLLANIVGFTHENKDGTYVQRTFLNDEAQHYALIVASMVCLYVLMQFIRCHLRSEMETSKWLTQQLVCYVVFLIALRTAAICWFDAVLSVTFQLFWVILWRQRKCETLTYGTLFVLFTSLVIASYVIMFIDKNVTP